MSRSSRSTLSTRFAPYVLSALVPGGGNLPRTSRRVRNLKARTQRTQRGWGEWSACLALTGQENIKTRTAERRAGTPANRRETTHVVWQPDGLQTHGGIDAEGNLWYIPR
jgi:hypothetical protein